MVQEVYSGLKYFHSYKYPIQWLNFSPLFQKIKQIQFQWFSSQGIVSVFWEQLDLNWIFKFLKMDIINSISIWARNPLHFLWTDSAQIELFIRLLEFECKNSQNPEWYLAFENDAQGLRVLGHFHAAWGIHVKVRNSWIRYSVRHLASKSDVAWSLQIFVQNL